MSIETFVFFDINTVGYSVKAKKQIKILELTLIAVSRKDIIKANGNISPPLGKLTLLFNPQKDIPNSTVKSTGLSNDFLMNQPVFNEKTNTINAFLDLHKPVCLVACHGNRFDYKVLRSEYVEANAMLPNDLLCVDPVTFFAAELKRRNPTPSSANSSLLDSSNASLNTSGPQADPSDADDSLNDSMAELTTEPTPRKEKTSVPKTYKNIFNKEPSNSPRTEVTARMLLACVIATKQNFLPWAEEKRKLINTIEPFPTE